MSLGVLKDPHDSGTESDEEELQTITSRCGGKDQFFFEN